MSISITVTGYIHLSSDTAEFPINLRDLVAGKPDAIVTLGGGFPTTVSWVLKGWNLVLTFGATVPPCDYNYSFLSVYNS